MAPSLSFSPEGLPATQLVAALHHHVSSLCARLARLVHGAGTRLAMIASRVGISGQVRIGKGRWEYKMLSPVAETD
jgi:hypothetical protein